MADLNELKPVGKLNPFAKFCCTIGNLPTSYMISLTYEEQLLWLCNYLENTVIPAVNTNAEAVQELQELYVVLKNYVDHYFENLDVQEEINNKLDEMAEDGTLQEIITAYLNVKGILAFNTVLDMKNATNIVNGSFVKTYGNLTYNDGKGEFYKIREVTNEDVIDEINIIAINNNNQLVAELMKNYRIEQLENDVEDLKNESITSIFGVNSSINLYSDLYYVDYDNGNDENDGKSENTPFKTVQPIFDKINKGKLKVEFFLKRGQTHVFPSFMFNSCTVHIFAYGDGNERPKITTNKGTTGDSMVFYNCHTNFQNVEFINIGQEMYCDGGALSATNTYFNCKYTSWGCGCRFDNCIIKTLKLRSANIWAYGDNNEIGCIDSAASVIDFYKVKLNPSYNINHDLTTNVCFKVEGGSLTISGSTSVITNDTPAIDRMFLFVGIPFFLSSAPGMTTQNSPFSQTSIISCCKVISTTVRLSKLQTTCNGIEYQNGTEYPT